MWRFFEDSTKYVQDMLKAICSVFLFQFIKITNRFEKLLEIISLVYYGGFSFAEDVGFKNFKNDSRRNLCLTGHCLHLEFTKAFYLEFVNTFFQEFIKVFFSRMPLWNPPLINNDFS